MIFFWQQIKTYYICSPITKGAAFFLQFKRNDIASIAQLARAADL